MNQRVPSYEHRECAHFYAATGLCSSPRPSASAAARTGLAVSSTTFSQLQPLPLPHAGSDASSRPSRGGAASSSSAAPSLEERLAWATSAPADESATSDQSLRSLRTLVSIGVKVVTRLRNHVHFILHTIHARYPGVRLIVADDEYVGVGGEEWRRMHELLADYNATYVQLVPRSGLSAGRNALVDACKTKYLVILDDDVFFTAATRLETLLDTLESQPDVQIAAGAYAQYASGSASTYVHDYSLRFAASTTEASAWYAYTPTPPEAGRCYPVDAAHNFFMARTEALRRNPWHPKMSIFEHEHFFFQLFIAKKKVLSCPHVSIFHYRAPNRELMHWYRTRGTEGKRRNIKRRRWLNAGRSLLSCCRL